MSELLYKTRGMSRPQGKANVYFCSAEEDFSQYFENISEELLKRQNCALWYSESPCNWDEDFISKLQQMQLFIIPVTKRFLTTDNQALLKEFPFALKNRIPVLPLLEEQGLEKLFGEKMGNLLFLCPWENDPTAISFSTKLDSFLSSVLVGDETAEKIRAAFDAYVFMSYRKKDRAYAQRLMRLIHKNDFCRDIAIWYDEYLSPGEDFNDAIKDALEKSKLFALVVTPNLVNENNYVMNVEYPAARKAEKAVLPFELLKTDHEALSRDFENLPSCINPNNASELSETMLSSLRSLAIESNDHSPEHCFFIGLAYLGGVDVEVDKQRGLELIQSAAESQLPEAMEKLVSMYELGEGVERSGQEAALWQERLTELREADFKESSTRESAVLLLEALKKLGELHLNLGNSSKAHQHFETLSELASQLYEATEDEYFARKIAEGKTLCGMDIRQKGSIYYSAAKYFASAEKICQALYDINPSEENLRALILSLINSGISNVAEKKRADAAASFEKAREALTGLPDSSELQNLIYSELGKLAFEDGKFSEAENHFCLSLEGAEKAFAENPSADSQRKLASACGELARLYTKTGPEEKAQAFLSREKEICSELLKEQNSVQTRLAYSACLEDEAGLYRKKENLTDAELSLWQAADFLREDSISLRAGIINGRISSALSKRAELCMDLGLYAQAQNIFEERRSVSADVYSSDFNSTTKAETDKIKLALSLVKQGKKLEAWRLMDETLKDFTYNVENNGELSGRREFKYYCRLACFSVELYPVYESSSSMKELMEKFDALREYNNNLPETEKREFVTAVLALYRAMAEIKAAKSGAARRSLRLADKIFKKLLEGSDEITLKRLLGLCSFTEGRLHLNTLSWLEALKSFNEAEKIYSALYESSCAPAYEEEIAGCLLLKGFALSMLDEYALAEKALEAAETARLRFYEEAPCLKAAFFKSDIHMARCYLNILRNDESAEAELKLACEAADEAGEAFPCADSIFMLCSRYTEAVKLGIRIKNNALADEYASKALNLLEEFKSHKINRNRDLQGLIRFLSAGFYGAFLELIAAKHAFTRETGLTEEAEGLKNKTLSEFSDPELEEYYKEVRRYYFGAACASSYGSELIDFLYDAEKYWSGRREPFSASVLVSCLKAQALNAENEQAEYKARSYALSLGDAVLKNCHGYGFLSFFAENAYRLCELFIQKHVGENFTASLDAAQKYLDELNENYPTEAHLRMSVYLAKFLADFYAYKNDTELQLENLKREYKFIKAISELPAGKLEDFRALEKLCHEFIKIYTKNNDDKNSEYWMLEFINLKHRELQLNLVSAQEVLEALNIPRPEDLIRNTREIIESARREGDSVLEETYQRRLLLMLRQNGMMDEYRAELDSLEKLCKQKAKRNPKYYKSPF